MYLYFGDDDMTGAAAYLCGIMTYYDMPFERIDSSQSPSDALLQKPCEVYILSDYQRERFQPGQLEVISEAVKNGAGLVMFGGWESYHGRLGEYHETILADLLPVTMLQSDDRRNFSQGLVLAPTGEHPILDGLPWDYPPVVGGLNEFRAKPEAQTLLDGLLLDLRFANGQCHCTIGTQTYPILVVGKYGQGRVAALATDVAPHWVGEFVDWGKERITQKLPKIDNDDDDRFVEIGADYAKFFAQLLRWVKGEG